MARVDASIADNTERVFATPSPARSVRVWQWIEIAVNVISFVAVIGIVLWGLSDAFGATQLSDTPPTTSLSPGVEPDPPTVATETVGDIELIDVGSDGRVDLVRVADETFVLPPPAAPPAHQSVWDSGFLIAVAAGAIAVAGRITSALIAAKAKGES